MALFGDIALAGQDMAVNHCKDVAGGLSHIALS
jgi:hypothetical protein